MSKTKTGNDSQPNRLGRAALERVAKVFSAFADPTRLVILQELRAGERTVGELVEVVGLAQGSVSKQLQLLFDTGLLGRRKIGTQVIYSIADEVVISMCEQVCDKLERDARASAALIFRA
jgi:DNA-binding transcriptional ArsR family regulator